MADQQTPQISDADIESLAQKLEHFNQSLTPGEQAALAEVFERAMPEGEDDVQGFGRMQARTADTARTADSARTTHTARTARTARVAYTAQSIRLILGSHLGVR